MGARRYDDDDDWEDSGEFEELEIEEEPGVLTTTRILIGLLVVVPSGQPKSGGVVLLTEPA